MKNVVVIIIIILFLLLIMSLVAGLYGGFGEIPRERFWGLYTQKPHKTIAICFWGLTRSLQHTISSIEEMILEPLREHGFQYKIFLHTYQLGNSYSNKRTGEKDCFLDPEQWKLLEPDHVRLENQEKVDQSLQLEKYHSSVDPWENNYSTLDNHVRALWSLYQVSLLWENSHTPFNYVMYCRPDVLFLTPLEKSFFDEVDEKSIILPDFHEYPINDRFCIAKPKVAVIYGKRFLKALEYSKTKSLHSETFLRDTLRSHKITIHKRRIRFQRFRACSTTPQNDTTA